MSGPYYYDGQYHEEKSRPTPKVQVDLEREVERLRAENAILCKTLTESCAEQWENLDEFLYEA